MIPAPGPPPAAPTLTTPAAAAGPRFTVPERRPVPVNVIRTGPPASAAVEAAVRKAVRQAVSAAVRTRSQGLTEDNRRKINSGIQTAVKMTLAQQLQEAKSGTRLDAVKSAVLAAVMKNVRYR